MPYFIIFPSGDRTKISVVEITNSLRYELSDYAVASRREFLDKPSSITYAIGLAREHNLTYVGDDEGYLD